MHIYIYIYIPFDIVFQGFAFMSEVSLKKFQQKRERGVRKALISKLMYSRLQKSECIIKLKKYGFDLARLLWELVLSPFREQIKGSIVAKLL